MIVVGHDYGFPLVIAKSLYWTRDGRLFLVVTRKVEK